MIRNRELNGKANTLVYIMFLVCVGTMITLGLTSAMYLLMAFTNWSWILSEWYAVTRFLLGAWALFIVPSGIAIIHEQATDAWRDYKLKRKAEDGNHNSSTKN